MNGWNIPMPSNLSSTIQEAKWPDQPTFWDKLGMTAISLGQGVLQYQLNDQIINLGRQPIGGGPGLPPYNPPQFAPPKTQSKIPLTGDVPPQAADDKIANSTLIVIVAVALLAMQGGR